MLTHRGFSAWIAVDGNPLPEYLVAVDDSAHRVSCWVPSEEGKTFSVYWKDHGGKVETCAYIMLDGYLAPGRFLYGEGVAWRGGVRTGPALERPFIFQKVNETAVDFEDAAQSGKDVGTIVLRIKRVKFAAVLPPNDIQQLPSASRGKNGMCIGFGTEQPAFQQYPSTWRVEPYDNPGQRKPSTYVSFVFRYRSPEFLKAQGIVEEVDISTVTMAKPLPRRVASMPTGTPPVTITPSPSPPSSIRKSFIDPAYHRIGSQRLKRPTTEFRRTVSLKASANIEEERPVNYPGEGLIIFPFQKPSVNQSTEDDSISATPVTTSTESAT